MSSETKIILKRLFKEFIKPYSNKLIFAATAMVFVALSNAFHAWLVKPALDDIFVHLDRKMLVIIPLAMILVGVIKAIATYFQNFYMKFVGQRIITDMQAKLYSHLIYSDLSYLHQFSTGKIISRFSNDIITMRTSLSNVLTGIAKELLTVIFLIIVMFGLNWQLAILIFIGILWFRNLSDNSNKEENPDVEKTRKQMTNKWSVYISILVVSGFFVWLLITNGNFS